MDKDIATILPQGALFEMLPQGGYVKVSAVDPVTRLEVSIVGDRAAGVDSLKMIALRKLARVVARSQEAKSSRPRRADPPSGWEL